MSQTNTQDVVLKPGDLVDHFKVVRLVGRGGMGEVYLTCDTKLGRKTTPATPVASDQHTNPKNRHP